MLETTPTTVSHGVGSFPKNTQEKHTQTFSERNLSRPIPAGKLLVHDDNWHTRTSVEIGELRPKIILAPSVRN